MKIWILAVIATANSYVIVQELTVSVALMSLLIGGLLLLAKMNNTYLHLFTAFTVMVAYDCILMWEHEVPIWLLMPRTILLPMIMLSIILYLAKGFWGRVIVTVLGICGGELLYGAMLSSYHIPYTAGSKTFLDGFVVIIAVLICFQLIQSLYSFVMQKFYRRTAAPLVFEARKKDVR